MNDYTPITKELLASLPYATVLHYGHHERWRTNGQLKTWKSPARQHEFRQPIKHGLYAYDYITHDIAHHFHLESECPANG